MATKTRKKKLDLKKLVTKKLLLKPSELDRLLGTGKLASANKTAEGVLQSNLKSLGKYSHDISFKLDHEPALTGDLIQKTVEWAKEARVSSLGEAFVVLKMMSKCAEPVMEFELNKRWYPTLLTSGLYTGFFGSYLNLSLGYNICDIESQHRIDISARSFTNPDTGQPEETNLFDFLETMGLRAGNKENLESHRLALDCAIDLSQKTGCLVDCFANGLYKLESWFGGIGSVQMGTVKSPGLGCVDKSLESRKWDQPQLPFVRVFSLDQKRWLCVDIRDCKVHEYDKTITQRLVLPDGTDSIVAKVFEAKPEEIFGDVMRGRHGGMVVMASGPPGVGKTFTAEAFAEASERPLYILGLGEVGTDAHQVELNLRMVFERATRWNAVLLFDEAEVFLAERNMDLTRSAIVGVFLRLMDYYKGMLFLTTNRPEVIDPAFQSRITLHLPYPNLSPIIRAKIWKEMLGSAGLSTEVSQEEFGTRKEFQLNGRQIRNACRLARVLYGSGKISPENLAKSCNMVLCHPNGE